MEQNNPYEAPESAKNVSSDQASDQPMIEDFFKVKDLRVLAAVTKVALFLCALSTIGFTVVALLVEYTEFSQSIDLFELWDNLGSFYTVSFYLSALFVACWQIGSMKNARIINMTGRLPHNTPIMSVVMYAMPIVNWWVPFQAVREMCTHSMAEDLVPHRLLRFWWGAWLISFGSQMFDFEDGLIQGWDLFILALTMLATAAAAIALILIITKVTFHQYRVHEKHGNLVD